MRAMITAGYNGNVSLPPSRHHLDYAEPQKRRSRIPVRLRLSLACVVVYVVSSPILHASRVAQPLNFPGNRHVHVSLVFLAAVVTTGIVTAGMHLMTRTDARLIAAIALILNLLTGLSVIGWIRDLLRGF
jgi:hypothetical protein